MAIMLSSVHFSYEDLYSAIVKNDIAGTKKAVHYLGARIHVAKIWCGHTAMEYAARLGHLDQAKLIFRDLERYFDESDDYKASNQIASLFRELIPHRSRDPHFLHELINKYPVECGDVDELVRSGAFDLIEILVRAHEDHISLMVDSCFHHGQTRLFNMSDWVQEHPVFLNERSQHQEKDALEFAIMKGDSAEASRLITLVLEDRKVTFSCVTNSALSETLPIQQGTERTRREEQSLRCPSFVKLLIQTGAVDMVTKLLGTDLLPQVLQLTNLSETKLVEFVISTALQTETLSVVYAILPKLGQRSAAWWHIMYYELIVAGKYESAAAIKRFCPRYLDQGTKRLLYQIFGNNRPAMEFMKPDTPAAVICEVVDAIESYPRNRPSDRSRWRKSLYDFPVRHGRPDVVDHFRRYGLQISEMDVFRRMAIESFDSASVELRRTLEWDTETFSEPLLTSLSDRVNLAESFLGESDQTIAVTISMFVSTAGPESKSMEFGKLVLECVTETGKSVVFENSIFGNIEFLTNIESQRRKSLTLKKLCRLSARRCIRLANPGKSLTDAILSLYVDGDLPRSVVLYLLYRDEGVPQPLYYRLVRPVGLSDVDSDSESDSYYGGDDHYNDSSDEYGNYNSSDE